MTKPRFIYNLRKDTFNEQVLKELKPFGYLLAPNNASSNLRKMAKILRTTNRKFMVDNGNFSLIGKTRKRFSQEAKNLRSQVSSIEKTVNRSIRPRDVPQLLRIEYRDLAKRSKQYAKDLAGTGEEMFDEQISLNPTHLIGVEDLTMAVWLGLDIERTLVGYRLRNYRCLNKKVARHALERLNSLPEKLASNYYSVASAVSYNTALDAGRIFGSMGIKKIAMGFGAYMADSNYRDHMYINKRQVKFDGRVPTRYSRTVAVARGFWSGYLEETGTVPEAFHFLGLGAPIMIPLIVLSASTTEKLTFDATSPIKDAVKGGTLYVTKPAYLKVRARKVTWRLASHVDNVWDCPCPFCQAFVRKHPFRYELGHKWFVENDGRRVVTNDLRPDGQLFKAYPLFSEPNAGALRKEVNFARIGHNHWAIEKVIMSVRRASSDGRLLTRVENIIADYVENTSKPFAEAINFGLKLAKGQLEH